MEKHVWGLNRSTPHIKTNRNQRITSVGENVGTVEHSYTAGENVEWCSHFEKVAVPQNVKQSCRLTQHFHSCIKRNKTGIRTETRT